MFRLLSFCLPGVSRFKDEDLVTFPEDGLYKRYLRCEECQSQFGGVKVTDLCGACGLSWQGAYESFVLCGSCAERFDDLSAKFPDRSMVLPVVAHPVRHADWVEYSNDSDRGRLRGFCLDAHVFDLVRLLNDSGVFTAASCEGST